MTPTETVLLTRYVKAQKAAQQFDTYTEEAWHDTLGHLRLSDCREAVRRLAGEHRWIDPSDIVKTVRAIRQERIMAAPPVPIPAGFDPDDTAAYRALVAAHERRAADGEFLPQPAPLPRRDLRAIENVFPSPPPVRASRP
jgi:hypothetical protein